MQLSVVIITRNEERNIARCIASVRDLADDIVVLDSFSTDRTEELVRAAGARFLQHPFDGHIEQKNRAISHARNPWVLSLDADEELSPELADSIRNVLRGPQADGYTMNRLTNYCGSWIRHGGWYPDTKLRLWDARLGAWTGVNPHDRYEMRPGSRIGHLKGDLLHHSYHTREDHHRQVEYFTTIAAKAYHAAGRRPTLVKRFASPAAKFIGDYLLRLGFLDGAAGLAIARISAHATWLKYEKLRRLYAEQ